MSWLAVTGQTRTRPPTCPELRGDVRGHRGSHHGQGTHSVLELGAVENDSLRGLLGKRKEQCENTEAHRKSLGKEGIHVSEVQRHRQASSNPPGHPFALDEECPPSNPSMTRRAAAATAKTPLLTEHVLRPKSEADSSDSYSYRWGAVFFPPPGG